jgi:stage II sporulation protein E
MRQTGIRQFLAYIIAGAVCRVGILGCYPLIPAVFAALYIADMNRLVLGAVMYVGIFLSLTGSAAAKYAVSLIVITGAVRLVEWANERCPAFMAGVLAATTTVILSFAGSLLAFSGQPGLPVIFTEGIFIAGATVLIRRFMHDAMYVPDCVPGDESGNKCGTPHRGGTGRLVTYAEAYQRLSGIFGNMNNAADHTSGAAGDTLMLMQGEVTDKICASCESCAICWDDTVQKPGLMWAKMAAAIASGTKTGAAEQEKFRTNCIKSSDMVEEATRIFERMKLNHAWYMRLVENRQAIAEQLDAMAYIMKDCAREEKVIDDMKMSQISHIKYQARELGIEARDLHIVEMPDGRVRLGVSLNTRAGGCISLKSFINAAGCALGVRLRAANDDRTFIGKEPCGFTLYEDTRYRSVQGIARMTKEGGAISGDNFSYMELECGDLVMGLSDGMGSGSAACRESEMALDMLEHFMEAGFTIDTAIRMMNSAMVIKGENDRYSTIDLCRINLYDGSLTSYKIGAAATFIRHDDEVRVIDEASLPAGVKMDMCVAKSTDAVSNGDFIVMVTDGVLEYLHVADPKETMCTIIESIDTNNPGILSRRIMERVMLFTGGRAKDDMTILAACIWEKK